MVGFPHSEISGSKLIRSSPKLIAAYYVLHRLHAPRHPLDALKSLDRSHYQCPQPPAPLLKKRRLSSDKNEMTMPHGTVDFDRSDQINQNSRGISVPPRGTGQTDQKAISLRCRKIRQQKTRRNAAAKLALYVRRYGDRHPSGIRQSMVEPDGIEPTTSCLQSTRSPN